MKFQRPTSDLLFSKNDPIDPRLGESVKYLENPFKSADQLSNAVSLIGFPDDKGIANNGGRIGASKGPEAIRRWLYRMTSQNINRILFDLGDLSDFASEPLEKRHEFSMNQVKFCL